MPFLIDEIVTRSPKNADHVFISYQGWPSWLLREMASTEPALYFVCPFVCRSPLLFHLFLSGKNEPSVAYKKLIERALLEINPAFKFHFKYINPQLVDGYCSITVVNHDLIRLIRFVAPNYTHL